MVKRTKDGPKRTASTHVRMFKDAAKPGACLQEKDDELDQLEASTHVRMFKDAAKLGAYLQEKDDELDQLEAEACQIIVDAVRPALPWMCRYDHDLHQRVLWLVVQFEGVQHDGDWTFGGSGLLLTDKGVLWLVERTGGRSSNAAEFRCTVVWKGRVVTWLEATKAFPQRCIRWRVVEAIDSWLTKENENPDGRGRPPQSEYVRDIIARTKAGLQG